MKLKSFKVHCILLYIAYILFASNCTGKPSETEEEIVTGKPFDLLEAVISESDSIIYDLSYTGVLPCKDCGGIKTTLKISTRSNKYSLQEEFLKTEIAPNVSLGNFNTERGFEKDTDATVYVLNDELPETEHLYFVRETGKADILLKLDNSRHRTDHTNFELKKGQ